MIEMHWCFVQSTVIPPIPMGISSVECPRQRGRITSAGVVCLSHHSSTDLYIHTARHMKVFVTVDENIVRSGVFNIVMTNKSNRHIKIHSNQTKGMLHSCDDSQICTIHEIIRFDKNPRKGRDGKSDPDLYHVHTGNPRTGRLEVNTLHKKDFYPVQINEVGPNMTMCITGTQVYWTYWLDFKVPKCHN